MPKQLNDFTRHPCALDIMKEYRRLDDSITMRLNRNNAQWRDKDRIAGTVTASSNSEACESFWRELVGAHDDADIHSNDSPLPPLCL